MYFEKKQLRRFVGIVIVAAGISQIPSAAWAVSSNVVAETQNKTELTVSQIKDLAVMYNPTNKTYELNQKTLELNQTTTSNNLRNAQNSLNSGYDIDTSRVTALQTEIQKVQQQLESDPQNKTLMMQLADLQNQLAQAESSVDSAYASMESSYNSAISNIEQLNDTLDTYEDEQDDLDKTRSDWETQVRMIAEVLCMQVTQYEKNIELLEEQITFSEKSLKLAQVQQELGMALTTDVETNQTNLEENKQSLETAEENLSDVKRKINVLIGRSQDSPLEVTAMSVPEIVTAIPTYSQNLVDEILSNDYTLKTYERSIANYKNAVDGETDSDVLEAADNNIAGVNLNIEQRKRDLADKVKSQLAKMTSDQSGYETSRKKVATQRKELDVAQKKYDLGMLTGSELLQVQISYQTALVTHWKNSYNYYLDWQEYQALKNGVDTSTYAQYRM